MKYVAWVLFVVGLIGPGPSVALAAPGAGARMVASVSPPKAVRAPEKTERFLIEGIWRKFVTIDSQALTVSEDCRVNGRFDCAAYRALKKAAIPSQTDPNGIGLNPGLLACNAAGGLVAFGYSENGDSNSFCRFGDGSLIDAGTLDYYARKNAGE